MKNNKMRKALLIAGLGLGMGLSGSASAIDDLCVYFTGKCLAGQNWACSYMNTYC